MSADAVTPLRHRMIEDMNARKLSAGTQRGHVRGAWQLPRLRCERCSISRSNCGRSASRLAFGGACDRKGGRRSWARLGAAAKGIDPKAELLEQPFVAPRQGADRAGIDLLGAPARDAGAAPYCLWFPRARNLHRYSY
jgi:hypothetical protein